MEPFEIAIIGAVLLVFVFAVLLLEQLEEMMPRTRWSGGRQA